MIYFNCYLYNYLYKYLYNYLYNYMYNYLYNYMYNYLQTTPPPNTDFKVSAVSHFYPVLPVFGFWTTVYICQKHNNSDHLYPVHTSMPSPYMINLQMTCIHTCKHTYKTPLPIHFTCLGNKTFTAHLRDAT